MKKIIALTLILVSNLSWACSLVVKNDYVKAPVPGMDNTAGYMDLTNTSDKDIVIVGASSSVAKATELHTMSMSDDKMVMRQIESIKVPAGQTVNLQGNLHIMFIGLTESLKEGDQVKVKLLIEGQSGHEFTLPVSKSKKADHHHSHNEHHKHDVHDEHKHHGEHDEHKHHH